MTPSSLFLVFCWTYNWNYKMMIDWVLCWIVERWRQQIAMKINYPPELPASRRCPCRAAILLFKSVRRRAPRLRPHRRPQHRPRSICHEERRSSPLVSLARSVGLRRAHEKEVRRCAVAAVVATVFSWQECVRLVGMSRGGGSWGVRSKGRRSRRCGRAVPPGLSLRNGPGQVRSGVIVLRLYQGRPSSRPFFVSGRVSSSSSSFVSAAGEGEGEEGADYLGVLFRGSAAG